MNILFLGLGNHKSINERSISLDLLRVFKEKGDNIYIVCPTGEGDMHEFIIDEGNSHILKVKVGKIRNVNIIKKGINTVLLERKFINAIKRNFSDVHFDLILYPTPPITFLKVVEYVKKRDNAITYLMLKDIFPQNAVDIGLMTKSGVKGLLYRYFRDKEKKLYKVSDYIGCMSPANVDYLKRSNSEIDHNKIGICPNSVMAEDKSVNEDIRKLIREKYDIPQDKVVFIYGGNLGKPQGISFLIQCLEKVRNVKEAFFLIVGDGTEYNKLERYVIASKQDNLKLMKRLPKEDYDSMVGACDVGMIFLDHRFTIPNFPSRLLSYMQAKIPVLACTDVNSDVGEVISSGDFGWWCESNDTEAFYKLVKQIACENDRKPGDNGYQYMMEHYHVNDTYKTIIDVINKYKA